MISYSPKLDNCPQSGNSINEKPCYNADEILHHKEREGNTVGKWTKQVLAIAMTLALMCGMAVMGTVQAGAAGFETVPMIASSYKDTFALKSDGTVWAWGAHYYAPYQGYPGMTADEIKRALITPVQITGLGNVTAIAAGSNADPHILALKDDGTVWAWGNNTYGQLGNGTTERYGFSNTLVQVSGLNNVKAIAAGPYHSLALKNDGTVWAWGWTWLGDGIGEQLTPVQVQGLSNVTAISAGWEYSLVLKNDGTVWAWGGNYNGQLGDGTSEDRNTPVQVQNLSNVKAIAAGTQLAIALKEDNTVWAWGLNNHGQLGDGTDIDSNTPIQVNGISDVTAIAAKGAFCIALKKDGTVWAWGRNNAGQVGDGTTTDRNTPIQVQNLSDVTIEAGMFHGAALKSGGSVWVWGGYNPDKDMVIFSRTPVQVLGENGVGYLNLRSSSITPEPPHFWDTWPGWLVWILRYILFGWLWM